MNLFIIKIINYKNKNKNKKFNNTFKAEIFKFKFYNKNKNKNETKLKKLNKTLILISNNVKKKFTYINYDYYKK